MKYETALNVAIANTLSDWLPDMTNEEILQAVWNEDFDMVTFWEPFENMDGNKVHDHIENLAQSIHTASTADTEMERDFARTLANGSFGGSV
jgi:hypothetical protein